MDSRIGKGVSPTGATPTPLRVCIVHEVRYHDRQKEAAGEDPDDCRESLFFEFESDAERFAWGVRGSVHPRVVDKNSKREFLLVGRNRGSSRTR